MQSWGFPTGKVAASSYACFVMILFESGEPRLFSPWGFPTGKVVRLTLVHDPVRIRQTKG